MKKIFLKFFTFLLLFGGGLFQAFANTPLEIQVVYDKAYVQIVKKSNNNKQKILNVLTVLDTRLNQAKKSFRSQKNIQVVDIFIDINKKRFNEVLLQKQQEEEGKIYEEEKSKEENTNKIDIVDEKERVKNSQKISHNKRYTYKELENFFENYIDGDKKYFLENGVYYTYIFSRYFHFGDEVKTLSAKDFEHNGISLEKTLLIKQGEKYLFAQDYKKMEIISQEMLKKFSNKEQVLLELIDDNKNISFDNEKILLQIEKETQKILTGVEKKEEKIKKIYDYIVDNITYYEDFYNGEKFIYSGLATFEQKTGVCDGYVKLFLYMLSFAGIEDVQVERGYVYDSKDFPEYGHAWVRIGERYYDPTFDDPIGGSREGNYLYFNIPKELLYVNRIFGLEIPYNIKNLSFEQRKQLSQEKYYEIYEKFSTYPLLKNIENRKKFGFDAGEVITLEKLSQKGFLYEFFSDRKGYYYLGNLEKKYVNMKSYILVTPENIAGIFSSQKIDLSDALFFKLQDNNGGYIYGLYVEEK